mmetsp:Transcript_13524/g.21130  ORF Transcript_13524/g.21130 Transcript_13524/m.21130 type:complete len:99 (-) Transcript_13524:219-515(-)
MGVPIVTLYTPGAEARHIQNVTASLLKQVGLDDLIATSEEEYVRIAVSLSQDPGRLAELRQTLRGRCLETFANPVPERLTGELEDELRKMWVRYIQQS